MAERDNGKERIEFSQHIFAFIGAEGAGKTVQAIRLAEVLNIPNIATSDLLRGVSNNNPGPLGDEVRDMFKKGTYLPGHLLLQILFDRVSQEDTRNGFVLDGALRTLEEVWGFRPMLAKAGRDYHLTGIHLQAPLKILDDRMSIRRREDDTPEKIASRRKSYENNLLERHNAINSQEGWRIVEVDASPDGEELVFNNVQNALLQVFNSS